MRRMPVITRLGSCLLGLFAFVAMGCTIPTSFSQPVLLDSQVLKSNPLHLSKGDFLALDDGGFRVDAVASEQNGGWYTVTALDNDPAKRFSLNCLVGRVGALTIVEIQLTPASLAPLLDDVTKGSKAGMPADKRALLEGMFRGYMGCVVESDDGTGVRLSVINIAGEAAARFQKDPDWSACRNTTEEIQKIMLASPKLGRRAAVIDHDPKASLGSASNPIVLWRSPSDPAAQDALGWKYYEGKGVEQDDAHARGLFSTAAHQGHAGAAVMVGFLTENGRGGTKDMTKAAEWYRKAADAGNRTGMSNLGIMYEYGKGVTQSDVEAEKWYAKAAESGDPAGMNNVGRMYESGRGIPQDDAAAIAWYRKAAAAGNGDAKQNLARAQTEGRDAEVNAAFRKRPEFAGMRTSTQRAWREVLAVHTRFAGHTDSAASFREVADGYVAIDLVDVDPLLQKSIEQTVQALIAANEFASKADNRGRGRAENMRNAGQVGAAAGQLVGDGENPNADALVGGLIAILVTGVAQDAEDTRLRPQIQQESANVTASLNQASQRERDVADALTRKYGVMFIKAK